MRLAEYARAFFSQTPECLFACCKHWDGRGVRSGSLQNARRGVLSGSLAKLKEGRPHRELSKIGEGRPLREFGKNEEGRPLQEFLQTSRRAPAPGTLQNSRRGVRSERGRRGAEGDKSRGDTGRGGDPEAPSRKPSRKPNFPVAYPVANPVVNRRSYTLRTSSFLEIESLKRSCSTKAPDVRKV